jgi:AcrR family transcriptional regulator
MRIFEHVSTTAEPVVNQMTNRQSTQSKKNKRTHRRAASQTKGKPPRSTSHRSQRRLDLEAILAVATGMFARRGYSGTSLDDVAANLSVRKASLYHYINSKEDLLIEIFNRSAEKTIPHIEAIAALDLPVEERLRRMMHEHIAAVFTDTELHDVIDRELSQLSSFNQTTIRRRKRAYERIWESLFEEGHRIGVLRNIEPRLLTFAVLGMCNSIAHWYSRTEDSAEEIAGICTMLLERGWLADGDIRQGIWPCPDTMDQPLKGTIAAVSRLKEEVETVSRELSLAKEKLVGMVAEGRTDVVSSSPTAMPENREDRQ